MPDLPPSPLTSDGPRLVIIIPVFGHSALVCEALQSALAQKAPFGIHIVAVNDGCPNPETDLVLSALAARHRNRIIYLRKPNGGLSSARNVGIAYVLAHMPSVEALFMLDADNRLRPRAMASAMCKLDTEKGADWVYPSIDMFGIKARCDYSGPYSRLIHSEMNISEAGSLIHRRVFERGVLFDESYTQGFEDWHFFLQAGDAGFRGVNLEGFGFFYRKRPESMLANADRNRDGLLDRVRQAHPKLFHPVAQVRLEQDEAPRFAIYLADEDVVLLTSDPEHPEEVSLATYELQYWRSCTTPMKYRVPPFLVVTSRPCLDALRISGLLHWAFWKLEHAAAAHGLAYLTRRAPVTDGGVGIDPITARDDPARDAAVAWIIEAGQLKDLTRAEMHSDDLVGLLGEDRPMAGQALRFTPPAPAITEGIVRCVTHLHTSRYRPAGLRRWSWRQPSIAWRGKEHLIPRKWFNGEPAFPRVACGIREIGLIVERPSDGLHAMLDRLDGAQSESTRLHLFVMGEATAVIDPKLRARIDSISLLDEPGFDLPEFRRRQFNGLFLPAPGAIRVDDAAMGMLYWLDELHTAQCPAASRLMGALRRFGITTNLHLTSCDSAARSSEVRLALAYEHAYDRIFISDAEQAAYLRSLGMPASKIAPEGFHDQLSGML